MSTLYNLFAPRNTGYTVLPTDDDDDDVVEQPRPPTKLLGGLSTVGERTREKNPLLVAAVRAAGADATISRVDVKLVDVATGATVARMDGQGNGHFGVTGGLLCVVGDDGTPAVSVFDPATRDVTNIPAYADDGNKTSSTYVFGHVPATGEHKVLRVYAAGHGGTANQSCEILTLGGEEQRWRPAPSPPVRVGATLARHWAVIGGVAHFLVPQRPAEYDAIASFDLATERWRPSLLRCPLSTDKCHCNTSGLSLVELNGCLVFVHLDYRAYAMDMWVLTTTDLDRPGRWLPVEPLPLAKVLRDCRETLVRPLMVLDDGRIAFLVRAHSSSVVRVYNPRTGACLEVVDFGKLCKVVGLYRGKLCKIV